MTGGGRGKKIADVRRRLKERGGGGRGVSDPFVSVVGTEDHKSK